MNDIDLARGRELAKWLHGNSLYGTEHESGQKLSAAAFLDQACAEIERLRARVEWYESNLTDKRNPKYDPDTVSVARATWPIESAERSKRTEGNT